MCHQEPKGSVPQPALIKPAALRYANVKCNEETNVAAKAGGIWGQMAVSSYWGGTKSSLKWPVNEAICFWITNVLVLSTEIYE